MAMIDITGLNKGEVLFALYNASHVQGMGFLAAVDNYTLEDTIEKIFCFMGITCHIDYVIEYRNDYNTKIYDGDKIDFFHFLLDDNAESLDYWVRKNNYIELTIPPVKMQYKMHRAERIVNLVDAFPEIAEYLINILKGE